MLLACLGTPKTAQWAKMSHLFAYRIGLSSVFTRDGVIMLSMKHSFKTVITKSSQHRVSENKGHVLSENIN